jgi:hypothetical protein
MPELPFKIPEVKAEDNTTPPQTGSEHTSGGGRIKARSYSVSQRQYYIPHKAQIGIQKHPDRLPLYSELSNCHFTPWGPKPVHTFGPYPS